MQSFQAESIRVAGVCLSIFWNSYRLPTSMSAESWSLRHTNTQYSQVSDNWTVTWLNFYSGATLIIRVLNRIEGHNTVEIESRDCPDMRDLNVLWNDVKSNYRVLICIAIQPNTTGQINGVREGHHSKLHITGADLEAANCLLNEWFHRREVCGMNAARCV